MLSKILIASFVILLLFAGWLMVQYFARTFSRKHPEFGPMREEGAGCGSSCNCQHKNSCNQASKIYNN